LYVFLVLYYNDGLFDNIKSNKIKNIQSWEYSTYYLVILIRKTKLIKMKKKIKSLKKINMIEYSATRLTFKRDLIEPLNDEDYFIVHVSNDDSSYKMTKREFYETFNNVIKTSSYKKLGNYNYVKTPEKAFKYLK
jgi:hypothetical protein